MKPRLTLIALSLLNAQLSHANPLDYLLNTAEKPYPARVTGQFLGGNQQIGGFGDALLPVMENNKHLLFANGTAMLGQDHRSTFSGGLGYRSIVPVGLERGILGAYVFTDYYQTALRNDYFQLNPGIEWLKERYELRLQGYIPLSHRNQTYSNTMASNIPTSVFVDSGHANTLSGAVGHAIIDTPVGLIEAFGPGVELEAGRFIDYGKGMWLRLGGYHFSYSNTHDINGIEANLEAVINPHVSLLLQNNYDNQNNNFFSIGLRFNYGGSQAALATLEKQMTAPIIRHIARQSYGEALPTRTNFKATGNTFNVLDNIWFFSPQGTYPAGSSTTFANCTAEQPCLTIDSATAAQIGTLAPNANLFFSTGAYAIPSNNGSNWVNLQNGQTLWGRNTGWLSAATGNERPLINGGLLWGNQLGGVNSIIANGTVTDMRVSNINQAIPGSYFSYGLGSELVNGNPSVIGVAATGNMTVLNSDIQASNSNDNVNSVAIAAGNALNAQKVTATSINTGNADGTINSINEAPSYAIFSNNNISISDSQLTSNTSGNSTGGAYTTAFGLQSLGYSSITRSTFNVTSSGSAGTNSSNGAVGVNPIGGGTLSDSVIIAKSTGTNASTTGFASPNAAIINSSNITVTGTGSAYTQKSASVFGVNSSVANVSGSTLNVNAFGNAEGAVSQTQAFGIRTNTGQATVTNSSINVVSRGNASLGTGASPSLTNATGVEARSDAIVTGSNINATTMGSANTANSNARSYGVRSLNANTTVTDSTVNALSMGIANSTGNTTSVGILAAQIATTTNSTITAKTTGNAISSGSFAQAFGIQTTSGNALVTNSIVSAITTGTTATVGNTSTIGVSSGSSITFLGDSASVITAISASSGETAASAATTINNNSSPKSQCSTDGVNYHNCP